MTVTFKQFSSFISEAEGEQSPEKLTEIWDKILGKKEADKDKKEQDDKAKGKVLTAKEKLEKKKEDEEERKNELKKKRDTAWQNAKDHAEGRKKASVFGNRDDYVLHKMREGKDEDHDEWQAGYGFGKFMRKKNKTASTQEINDMSKAYKQGYMKALKESLDV